MRQPTPDSCFPTALAITLGIPLPGVFSYLREPDRDYTFNSQEISIAAMKLGWAMIGLSRSTRQISFDDYRDDRGIVIIQAEEGNHAIAQLDAETFIDPDTGERCEINWASVDHKFLLKKLM